jgi:hypothetical protein
MLRFGMVDVSDDELEYLAWEKKQHAYAFSRTVYRHCRKKRLCDCGHWVDGSAKNTEVYRYSVWRINSEPRGHINQRTDCDVCSRVDSRY